MCTCMAGLPSVASTNMDQTATKKGARIVEGEIASEKVSTEDVILKLKMFF